MRTAEKVFNRIVSIVVMLTGAGFGALTAFVYAEEYWQTGMLVGGVSAFPLAKMYLWQLRKAFSEGHNTWLRGVFTAIVSGVICTTIIHATMAIVTYPNGSFDTEIGNIVPITIIVGEIIGAVAGFILGASCSLIYVLSKKGEEN
jgi:hypothetical protein